jgi:hypothetical protein
MRVVHLLLKTQLLMCTRFPVDMSKYKYPAYQMLLHCLHLPQSCTFHCKDTELDILTTCLVHKDRAGFVKTALDLVFQTCLVSPLNAEELVAQGGIFVLCSLLNFYTMAVGKVSTTSAVEVEAKNLASDVDLIEIVRNLVRTIAGVCFYETGRAALLSMPDSGAQELALNWRKCVEGVSPQAEHSASIRAYALEGVASMAKSSALQELLVSSGIVWPMVQLLLGYDPTLEEAATMSDDQDDLNLSQAACNAHARLAARGLGMMCGILKDSALASPRNDLLFVALSNVLTPSIALFLRNKRTGGLLQTLNTNTETPLRIWNIPMRKELEAFLAKVQHDRAGYGCRAVDEELKAAISEFEYVALKGEVTIGGVYLRVLNSLTGDRRALQEIPNLNVFAKQLLNIIASCLNRSMSDRDGWTCLAQYGGADFESENSIWKVCNISDNIFDMAMETLKALVKVDELVDDVFCETEGLATPILMSMLELDETKVRRRTLNPMITTTRLVLTRIPPTDYSYWL